MRYVKPQINNTFNATSTIQGNKRENSGDSPATLPSIPAYEADE